MEQEIKPDWVMNYITAMQRVISINGVRIDRIEVPTLAKFEAAARRHEAERLERSMPKYEVVQ